METVVFEEQSASPEQIEVVNKVKIVVEAKPQKPGVEAGYTTEGLITTQESGNRARNKKRET